MDGEGLRSGDLASEAAPTGAPEGAGTTHRRHHAATHAVVPHAPTADSRPLETGCVAAGRSSRCSCPRSLPGSRAIVLEIPATGHTSNMLGIVGSVLALLAVPTAVAFGIPVEVGPVRAGLAIATSLLLWALLGWWASRRVSQRVIGGWREWLVEFGWVTFCLWAGVLTGVGVLLRLAS